jgi:uncharacterized protein YbbC (DUF1343 family)
MRTILCILTAVLLAGSFAAAQSPRVSLGADQLILDPTIIQGRRIGLVTHVAGVTAEGEMTAGALVRRRGLALTALFAPEHGISGTLGAGVAVPDVMDRTPVFSLYGGTFRPTARMLERVDVLMVDLQDVGVRAYTYASTMAMVMRAARGAGLPVIILDRPNPLGGLIVDGPVLEPHLRSFIGMFSVPYVHGLTLGELARVINGAFRVGADLTVVPMKGWGRSMVWADTGLSWVSPSPGIPSADTAFYYAITGPLDGTNLWNGVGTESRFQVVLAPWLKGSVLAERLNRLRLPGVRFSRSAVPHPRTGRTWYGIRVHVTDPRLLRPNTIAVHILAEIRRLHGSRLTFPRPRRGPPLFDLVWGTSTVRLALQRGVPASKIVAQWRPGLKRFQALRERYLLYR